MHSIFDFSHLSHLTQPGLSTPCVISCAEAEVGKEMLTFGVLFTAILTFRTTVNQPNPSYRSLGQTNQPGGLDFLLCMT
jgi:hypothetical protein